jgi:hypothetical protein
MAESQDIDRIRSIISVRSVIEGWPPMMRAEFLIGSIPTANVFAEVNFPPDEIPVVAGEDPYIGQLPLRNQYTFVREVMSDWTPYEIDLFNRTHSIFVPELRTPPHIIEDLKTLDEEAQFEVVLGLSVHWSLAWRRQLAGVLLQQGHIQQASEEVLHAPRGLSSGPSPSLTA